MYMFKVWPPVPEFLNLTLVPTSIMFIVQNLTAVPEFLHFTVVPEFLRLTVVPASIMYIVQNLTAVQLLQGTSGNSQ